MQRGGHRIFGEACYDSGFSGFKIYNTSSIHFLISLNMVDEGINIYGFQLVSKKNSVRIGVLQISVVLDERLFTKTDRYERFFEIFSS